MLNKNAKVKKRKSPFPYLTIPDFFDQKFYEEIENNFPKIEEFQANLSKVKRMDYDITSGDKLYDDLTSKNESYQKLHQFIYSDHFINLFLNYFKEDLEQERKNNSLLYNVSSSSIRAQPYELNGVIGKKTFTNKGESFLYPRIDIGLGMEGYGKNNGGGGIHIDNPQRLISILFYVGGFDKIKGGEHRIWKRNKDNTDLEIHESIKPASNLLIAGLQTNDAFHDVNPVEEITGSRNAFYLAISSSTPIWHNVKYNKFNSKFNKNRAKPNLLQKILRKLKKLK